MFVERKIPWHLSIGGKAERYDRLKLVPDLYGIREGKRPSGCDSLPSLPGLLVHPRKRRPNAWSVAIEKVRGNELHVGLGRIGCSGGCAGQRRHVALQGFLHFCWRLLNRHGEGPTRARRVRRPSQGDRAIENHSRSQRKTSIRKALRRQCNKSGRYSQVACCD